MDNYHLLSRINSPQDLQKLEKEQLEQVCKELRNYIIEILAETPGHLSSNLGTVELTVALHYVFNAPYDRIVWDVGHQAYVHKILTGRRKLFCTLRKLNGISGFPNPEESEYDSFIAGHASNSISAALGMAIASKLKKENRKIVAVIGDGSMTGGLAFEGLNNVSSNPNNLLIILNDNNMAIDRPVGGLSQSLVKITTSHTYNTIRYKLYTFLNNFGFIKNKRKEFILRFNNSLKALLTKQHNIFEGLNIRYLGPIDGHNIKELIKILNDIKNMTGPKLLHVRTVKGKGFKPAENKPNTWHAPGKFNPKTGKLIKIWTKNNAPLYQDVFGYTLVELSKINDNIVGITPAMITGCSMNFFKKKNPDRTFDVGIAEGHAVTFACGLAKEGIIPFCNIYSSFMQRAYDNIIHDAALQNLNIVLCLDRAGLVGEDGVTHHGTLDLAYLNCIPNITVAAPMNEIDLRNLMFTAIQPNKGVFAIRYPKGKGKLKNWNCSFKILPVGKGRKLKEGKKIAVISIGTIGNSVKEAIHLVEKLNLNVAHYDMIYLKPIDEELLHEIGGNYQYIIVIEDGTVKGGLGTAVVEFMFHNRYTPKIKQIGVPDKFIPHGTINELHELCGMDVKSIVKCLIEI
ncbi:MAG: 1-deoxy-D-xylulose-5-phosphate synthase [Bacteroidales bacterium OttesenSCG-928-I14]|jgi:1-deoxy-D-xylulose-5-phosphate synthase|nr:1-deoxy-D-xylulose-5-phosphate synthase [Bacteroidales bacterium OttesenSCG-928-I14]